MVCQIHKGQKTLLGFKKTFKSDHLLGTIVFSFEEMQHGFPKTNFSHGLIDVGTSQVFLEPGGDYHFFVVRCQIL